MTDQARARIELPVGEFQVSPPRLEGLDPLGERKVGWAAGAVFFVWVALFLAWIFLAPPADTSASPPEPPPPRSVAVLAETNEPTALPPPSSTPVQATQTPVPAVADPNLTATATLVPAPTWTATPVPPTPVSRSPALLTLFEEEVRAITGMGNMVYLGIDSRVVALDVTDPTFPVWIGEAGDLPGPVEQLAWVSEHIYALHPGGVTILDVSEPGDLVTVGSVETDPGLLDLVPGGDRLYGRVGGGEGSALAVYNVGDPQAPRRSAYTPILQDPFDFKVVEPYGYLTHGSRLSVLNLEDPEDPRQIGTYEFPGAALSVAPVRNHAFVGVAGAGLYVLSLADPGTPEFVSLQPVGGEPVAIQALYDGVLVVLTEVEVVLFDISQPAALQQLGAFPLPGRLQDLQLTDEIAFIALGEAGMVVVDLSQ